MDKRLNIKLLYGGSLMTKTNKPITRQELTNAVAKKVGVSQDKASEIVIAFIDEIVENLNAGNDVKLPAFAKFEIVERPARTMHLFGSEEELKVPAKTAIKVRPLARLAELTKEK